MTKIMVVDNSGYTRKMIVSSLKAKGINDICEASSGEEALKKIEVEKPNIVLLEIILSGKDGIEVLKEIKKSAPQTKVIIVSVIGQESYFQEAKKLKADDYIVKPFNPDELFEKIKKIS